MAVTLTGTDGLFTRLGKLYYIIELLHKVEAGASSLQAVLDAELEDVADEFTKPDLFMLKGLAEDSILLQTQLVGAVMQRIQLASENIIIEMVDADTTLPSRDLNHALRELIRQMEDSGDDVEPNTTTTNVVANANNVGDGAALVSYAYSTSASDKFQYNRAETLRLQCVRDAQVSGTPGQEVFTLEGEQPFPAIADPRFPGGSGIRSRVRVMDPTREGTARGRNRIQNGAFENFTANSPDNWTLGGGITAGTDVDDETTLQRRGAACLKLIGDASTTGDFLTSTAYTLKPGTVYCLGYWFRDDGSLSAGAWSVEVRDAASTVLADASSDHTSSSSTWNYTHVFFQTPDTINNNHTLVIEVTTALSNTHELLIDGLFLTEAQQFGGPNGPFVVIMPGDDDSNWNQTDLITIGVVRATQGKFQTYLDMLHGLNQRIDEQTGRGFTFPFDGGTPSISDSLIS